MRLFANTPPTAPFIVATGATDANNGEGLEDLNEAINNMQQAFESIAYNVEICYIPVVYAAETLMLYQYLSEENGVRIFNLVSSVNTNYLHLCILAYLTGRANVRHAKRVREFLDIHRLVDNFKSMVEYDINREVKQWIIDGCNVESQSLFDKHDALEHLKETESIFNCWKAQSNRTLKIDEHIIALDKTVKPLMKMK